jgi:hypothetical protein
MYDEQESQSTAVTTVEQSRAIQEIKAQVVLARHFPRNIMQARAKILEECQRPRFAEIALYQYPRGKKKNSAGQWVANIVAGPSIRLAEVMARSFTNMKFGIRVMSRRDGMSDVQTYAWDMESNVIETRDFIVKHERKSGDKTVKLTDDRDIYEMEANQGARRMRACILALIPKDIQDEAQEEVDKTTMNNLQGEAGVDRIKKMVDKFADLDVTQKMIEEKFGVKLKSLDIKHWAELGRIYNSLKDGIGNRNDYFGLKDEAQTDTKKTRKVEENLEKADPKPKSKPAASEQKAAPEPQKEEKQPERPPESTKEPERADSDMPDAGVDGVTEKEAESWGDKDEVEEAAKTVDEKIEDLKAEIEHEDEPEETEPDPNTKDMFDDKDGQDKDIDEKALLKDAYPEEKAKRKTKYLREKANEAREALEAYSDEKAPNGIHNLGELCAYFNLNAVTAYDITVGVYDDIMEFIRKAKSNWATDGTLK